MQILEDDISEKNAKLNEMEKKLVSSWNIKNLVIMHFSCCIVFKTNVNFFCILGLSQCKGWSYSDMWFFLYSY